MTLRLKAPKFLRKMAAKYISKVLAEEMECDVRVWINEAEIGMRNKRIYTHMNVDADIDRKDLWQTIKTSIKEGRA